MKINNKIFSCIIGLILVLAIGCINNRTTQAQTQDNIESSSNPTNLVSEYNSYLPLVYQNSNIIYYVSPSGSDSNPGTFYLPWKTIKYAARKIEPGVIIYIREGIYNEAVSFTISGTETQPISIIAFPGEKPVIDGQNSIPGIGGSLLSVSGDYIHVQGLEIRNSAYAGIHVLGDFDIVRKMYVHHNRENGILISQGNDSIVENNLVWRNALSNEYLKGNGWSSGISAARNGVKNATIRKNTVWENWGEGISTFNSDLTMIENNITHDNFSMNIYISDSTNVVCQSNFVYSNPSSYIFPYSSHHGISMGDETYEPPSSNITIINNISIGNKINLHWWPGVEGGGMNQVLIANNTFVNAIGDSSVAFGQGTHNNVKFLNNIIQQEGTLPVINVFPNSGIFFANNLWSKSPIIVAAGSGDIIANPQFIAIGDKYSSEWYTISISSPAINQASPITNVKVDYFGQLRGILPDIGADELDQ